jgi:hypothetical protein
MSCHFRLHYLWLSILSCFFPTGFGSPRMTMTEWMLHAKKISALIFQVKFVVVKESSVISHVDRVIKDKTEEERTEWTENMDKVGLTSSPYDRHYTTRRGGAGPKATRAMALGVGPKITSTLCSFWPAQVRGPAISCFLLLGTTCGLPLVLHLAASTLDTSTSTMSRSR